MRASGRRTAAALAAAAAALAALWAGAWLLRAGPGIAGALADDEARVRAALAAAPAARLDLPRAGGEMALELDPPRYGDLTLSPAAPGLRAVAMVEASGRVVGAGLSARLGYVGRETFEVAPCAAGPCAVAAPHADLRAVLALLLRRREALARGDGRALGALAARAYRGPGGRGALLARLAADLAPARPPPRREVEGWQIRIDREGAVVGEDALLALPGRPPSPVRARLELVREGDGWAIADGL